MTVLRALLAVLLLPIGVQAGQPSSSTFDFSLAEKKQTSAGIFAPDGRLVRTLWSGVTHAAGKHQATWDWTDDDGRLVDDGAYEARILSSNLAYTWEGVVGNTSREKTGPTVHHPLMVIHGIAVTGRTAHFCTYYNEGYTSQFRFEVDDPQAKKMVLAKGADFCHVVSDGKAVYWGGNDTFPEDGSFVIATDPATDQEISFEKGRSLKTRFGCTYASTIGLVQKVKGAEVTGLAVQPTGPFLFIARAGLDRLDVLSKSTGEKLFEIKGGAPRALACDRENNLWMAVTRDGKPVVEKVRPAPEGALRPLLALKGLVKPLALAVSPDDRTLLVADGGASQQLKAFGAADGAPRWTYGQAGGYSADPAVRDDKFDFITDFWHFPVDRATEATFLAFQPDGSFWVGDGGCFRVHRFSSERKLLDTISYVPLSYSVAADPNDPARVFADYLEFQVDYDKPLAPGNGSWKLVRNWRTGVPAGYDDYYRRMRCVTTLKNGRTYALFSHQPRGTVFELSRSGLLRPTGAEVTASEYLCADGSLRSVTTPQKDRITWSKRELTGFDANGNPSWSAPAPLASAPAADQDPVWRGNTHHLRGGQTTPSNFVISFDETVPEKSRRGSVRWRLGAVKAGGTEWLWKASANTPRNYVGPWPTDGSFPIAGVFCAASAVNVVGPNIFYGYYGEGYNGMQANKWRHYHESGLLVGDFGVVGWHGMPEAYPGMAGNAFSSAFVKLRDGRMYLYHNDESHGGGVHRWRIDGENTLAIQTRPLSLAKAMRPGLLGEYFEGPDCDRIYLRRTRVDGPPSFEGKGDPPAGEGVSARWTGFLRSRQGGAHAILVDTNGDSRLWVDGARSTDGKVTLPQDRWVPIRVEVGFRTKESARLALKWIPPQGSSSVIPLDSLCAFPGAEPAARETLNLLDSLPFNAAILDRAYGWTRTPASQEPQDATVLTNTLTFGKPVNDLFVKYAKPGTPDRKSDMILSRDLGPVRKGLTEWTLHARVTYKGNYQNHGREGGQFFEVLDDQGKVIARFFPAQIEWPNVQQIHANDAVMLKVTHEKLKELMHQFRGLDITARNGEITFRYADLEPVRTKPLDAASDWRRPKSVRLYFWTAGAGYQRQIGLEELTFSADVR